MSHSDPASWAWVCKFTFLRGVLEFGRGGPNALREAIMDFENIAPIGDSEHPTNKCLDIIRTSEHEVSSTQDIMKRMMILLEPAAPLVCGATIQSVLAGVDRERYILRELGYGDDSLEDEISQKYGWSTHAGTNEDLVRPFDMGEADSYIAEARSKFAKKTTSRVIIGQRLTNGSDLMTAGAHREAAHVFYKAHSQFEGGSESQRGSANDHYW